MGSFSPLVTPDWIYVNNCSGADKLFEKFIPLVRVILSPGPYFPLATRRAPFLPSG